MARADRTAELALREWARPPYDVTWFSTAPSFEWTGRPDFGPTIVDLMDLEDAKARLRAGLLAEQLRSGTADSSLRTRLALWQPGSTVTTGADSSGRLLHRWSGWWSQVTRTRSGPP